MCHCLCCARFSGLPAPTPADRRSGTEPLSSVAVRGTSTSDTRLSGVINRRCCSPGPPCRTLDCCSSMSRQRASTSGRSRDPRADPEHGRGLGLSCFLVSTEEEELIGLADTVWCFKNGSCRWDAVSRGSSPRRISAASPGPVARSGLGGSATAPQPSGGVGGWSRASRLLASRRRHQRGNRLSTQHGADRGVLATPPATAITSGMLARSAYGIAIGPPGRGEFRGSPLASNTDGAHLGTTSRPESSRRSFSERMGRGWEPAASSCPPRPLQR